MIFEVWSPEMNEYIRENVEMFKKSQKKLDIRQNYIKNISDNIWISINPAVNETALCMDWNFYIIMWNYRDELENLNDLEEIKSFFKSNEDKKGSWSDDFIF